VNNLRIAGINNVWSDICVKRNTLRDIQTYLRLRLRLKNWMSRNFSCPSLDKTTVQRPEIVIIQIQESSCFDASYFWIACQNWTLHARLPFPKIFKNSLNIKRLRINLMCRHSCGIYSSCFAQGLAVLHLKLECEDVKVNANKKGCVRE